MKQEAPSSKWRGDIAEGNKPPEDGDLIPGFNVAQKALIYIPSQCGLHFLWETEERGLGISQRCLCVPGNRV